MANKPAIIFATLSFIFLIVILFLLTSVTIYKDRAKEGEELAKDVSIMLTNMDKRCSTSYRSIGLFDKECVKPLLVASEFKEDEFENVDMKNNRAGYIVIKNKGLKSYQSDMFILYKNREVVDEGCIIPGKIDPGYTCRMNFDNFCDKGDVLEIRYNDTKVFIKNC